MIEKLTKEQEEKIPKFIEKWVKMANKPTDRAESSIWMKKMYSSMGENEPVIIYGLSPLSTSIMACMYWNLIKNMDNKSQLYSQLRSQLDSQLRSQLDSQLYSQLRSQLDSQLRSQLDSQLYSQLRSQLDSQLRSQLRSQLDSQLQDINAYWYLSIWWLGWCGWYQYGKYIGVEFDKDKYDLFMGFVSNIGFSIPYKNICFISHNPQEIHWNNGQLHKDGYPAVKYEDGYSMWCLNGVRVPQYLVETSEGELDIEFFKKEKNADVKAEFIRKFGIERMISFGKKIDSASKHPNKWYRESEYELWNMGDVFGKKSAPFLKMKNLTTGIYHFEGVPDNCKTIDDALKFRTRNRLTELKGVK